MKAKRLKIVSIILDIVILLFFAIEFINPELTWVSICTLLLLIADVILGFWQNRELKRSGEEINTKKVVICIVVGAVLTIAAIWIILINVFTGGLE